MWTQLECHRLRQVLSVHQLWNFKTDPEVHLHLFLYGFKEMTLERSRLNGRKASDWLRLCHMTRGWCSIILLRLLEWYSTWVLWLGQWHCFPSKFGGKPTHVVNRKGRPSHCCMTLSPRPLKHPCFITKRQLQWSYNKNKSGVTM